MSAESRDESVHARRGIAPLALLLACMVAPEGAPPPPSRPEVLDAVGFVCTYAGATILSGILLLPPEYTAGRDLSELTGTITCTDPDYPALDCVLVAP
jgi:hypothetical protein